MQTFLALLFEEYGELMLSPGHRRERHTLVKILSQLLFMNHLILDESKNEENVYLAS